MSRRRTPLLPLLAAATLSLIGCGGDSPTQPIDTGGTISFSYGGAISGNFSAAGTLRLGSNQQPEFGSWAAGERGPDNELAVSGFHARTAPRGDAFGFYVPAATGPRTVAISPNCDPTGADCPVLVLGTNVHSAGGDMNFDRLCMVISGSITIAAMDRERVRGSFGGTGICFDGQSTAPSGLFTVTNGTFDVPLTSNLLGPLLARSATAQLPAAASSP